MSRPLQIFKLFIGVGMLSLMWLALLQQTYIIKATTQQPIQAKKIKADEQMEMLHLDPNGEVHDVHLAPNGDLIISDYGAEEIRVLSPRINQYTVYHHLGAVENAQMDRNGSIWWVNGVDRIAVLTPSTGLSTTWLITSDEQVLLSSLTFDDENDPWFAEGFGATSKLYQLRRANQQLCTHIISGGVASNDVAVYGNHLWLINWSQDILIRYASNQSEMAYWKLPANSFVEGLTVDGTGKIWWVDSNDESVNRFDETTNEWSRYPLPVGKSPLRVEAGLQRIWYTESVSGTVGSLLQSASGITTSLTAITTSVSVSCAPLVESSRGPVNSSSESIQWEMSSAQLEKISQWDIYHPAIEIRPFGLAIGQGFVWITDPQKQLLLRLPTSDNPATDPVGSNIYLPVVSR